MYRSLRRKKCVHMFHVCTYEIEKQWGERERYSGGRERERYSGEIEREMQWGDRERYGG